MRILCLSLALVACTTGDPKTCRIENFAAIDEKDQKTVQTCGSFSLDVDAGYNDAAMQAGHDCVLDAVAHARPFTFFYDVFDPFRHVRGGFVGTVDSAGKLQVKVYAYVGDTLGGSFDPRPAVTVSTCATVVDSGCMAAAGKPCLSCRDPGAGASLCRY